MRHHFAFLRLVLRGSAVAFVFSAGIALLLCGQAFAQAWPQKPIRVLVGFAAGGPPDIAARVLAPKLGEGLGQAVVVENRAGAGGVIAMEAVAKAPADGYMLALATSGTMFLAKALIPTAAYDPLTSFAPIGTFASNSFILVVRPEVPAKTVKEFIALAKAQPGKLNYGSSTPGSPPHILCEMFKHEAGVDIFGITYKGSADAITRFLAGDVQMMVDGWAVFAPLITSGKARALLVTTEARSKRMPEVPTAKEAGLPDFTVSSWFGLVAPAATPDPVIRRASAELLKAALTKEMLDALDRLGLDSVTSTPEQLAAAIKVDWPRWSAAVKASGAKAQ